MVRNDCSLIEDQVCYQQLTLPLLHSFHNTMKIGELGSVECGSFFLCRHEDRIMWIQVSKNTMIYIRVIASVVVFEYTGTFKNRKLNTNFQKSKLN